MTKMLKSAGASAAGLALAWTLALPAVAADPVKLVVYSAQKEPFVQPMLDAFTRETGIAVDVLTDQGPVLIERLAAEGAETRADVLLTVDAGNLHAAAARGLLRPLVSTALSANVPAVSRDPGKRWFGLSRRARAIVYAPGKVDPATLSTYAALADPEWRGKLCLRTSKNVYNQSLIATQIDHAGTAATEAMVRGWVANLAAAPLPDDTMAVRAVASGECGLAVVNMYYLARLKREDPNFGATVFWPDQKGNGVHVNIFGGAVTAHSAHPAEAQRLLEWWSGEAAQRLLASNNLEYPINPKVDPDPILAAFGPFKADAIALDVAGARQAEAVKLMDRAGWR